MAFVLQDVIKELEESRSLEPFKKLKETNLAKVAAHLGTTPAACATKSHILVLIEEHWVKHDIINEVEKNPTAETVAVLRLKLEFECEEWRLACEEAREEAQKARDAEKALQDAQLLQARELRLAELNEAHKLGELELKAEQGMALIEAKKEAAAHEYELKMAGLGKHPPSDRASAFDPVRNIRLRPPSEQRRLTNMFVILRKLMIV